MNTIDLHGGYLYIREVDSEKYKCRVFIKTGEDKPPLHVSSFRNHGLIETIFENGGVVYTLDMNKLKQPLEVYVFSTGYNGPSVRVYRVYKNNIVEYSIEPRGIRVSSGFTRVDDIVEEIVAYRRAWSNTLCGGVDEHVLLYEVFLKAKIGLNYGLFRRIKEAWIEYSIEYLGYIYSLVHSLLIEKGYHLESGFEEVERICRLVKSCSSVDWKGFSTLYKTGDRRIMVFLERMIGASKPDVLLSTSDKQVVVECKQGAPKTWVSKAIKQAVKYRRYANILVLITNRRLNREDYEELSKQYDYILEDCSLRNTLLCKTLLVQILNNVL